MKKLLLTLLITLTVLVASSQVSTIGRAYEFHLGEVIDDNIEWIREPTYVNILIQFNDHEIIIYSEEHQVYQIVEEMGRYDATVMWMATDKKGDSCWVFITELNRTAAAITIRYSDYAWMYMCRENK